MWPTHYIPNQPRVEGDPPPRYYLTTPPYPLELTESLASAGEEPELGFIPSFTGEEYLVGAAAPVSGILKSVLVEAEGPLDELISAAEPLSGIFRNVLIRIDIGRDELVSSGQPLSGDLKDPLVRYENWPLAAEAEGLISAGQPVSGVLT